MSTGGDETIRLNLDSSGFQSGARQAADSTDKMAARVKQLETYLRELDAAYDRGAVHSDAYRKEKASLERQLNQTTKAASQAAAATDNVGKSSGNTSYALLQLGRITQDVSQGGFAGGLNNIEGFASALGLGAGVAGMATVAGTALYLLGPTIKAAVDAMNPDKVNDFADTLEGLKERIDKLNAKPIKVAVDQAQLDALQARLGEIERAKQLALGLGERTTQAQQEAGKAAQEALIEAAGGGRQLLSASQSAETLYAEQAIQADPKLMTRRENLAAAERGGQASAAELEALRGGLAREEEKARKAAREQFRTDVQGAAFRGDERAMGALAGLFRGTGRADLATAMERNTPAEMAKRERDATLLTQGGEENVKANAKLKANQERIGQVADQIDSLIYSTQAGIVRGDRAKEKRDQAQADRDREQERRRLETARRSRYGYAAAQLGGYGGLEETLMQGRAMGLTNEQALEIAAGQARNAAMRNGIFGGTEAVTFGAYAANTALGNLQGRGFANDTPETARNTQVTEKLTTQIEQLTQEMRESNRRGVPMVLRRRR